MLKGQCLGANPSPEQLAQYKLHFGVVVVNSMHTARNGKTIIVKTVSTRADHVVAVTPRSIASSMTYSGGEVMPEDAAETTSENDDLMKPDSLHACFGFVDQVTLLKKSQTVT